ncbi:MAG: hypothetical protein AUG49_26260 [Catenulispora sp. 13_1_20CM_3_70_7]|nr:MAG: hypothetical protein AUG49_26260 [Catenulispora sp. 13_1_20CM_3_70_7]
MSELVRRLMTPFLPEDVYHRLRQQRLDAEAARRAVRVLTLTGVSVTVVNSSVGIRSGRAAELVPRSGLRYVHSTWLDYGKLSWDGTGVTAVGDNNSEGRWLVREGGVKPGFGAEEVARARLRPVTSGECPASVAEIAAVGLEGRPIRRLYLLDEESRRLTLLPARGLTEDRIAAFANDAGLGFRAYSITTGGRVHPDVLCDDVLFPRSSRQVRLVRRLSEDAEWQWTGRP